MPRYPENEDLIQTIKKLESRLERVERSAQLGSSSIDAGALTVTDGAGTDTMTIGLQPDGTYTTTVLAGPTPPRPNSPTAASASRGITVTWDGSFEGSVAAPLDFANVLVYVGAPGFNPTLVKPVHLFGLPGGTIYIALVPGVYEVVLYTLTQAGILSLPTAGVSATASTTSIGDTSTPATSPTPTVVGGVGSFFVSWPAVTNNDPVTYKVYAGTTSGFTADATTLVGTTGALSLNVRTLTNGTPFLASTDYYFKIIATDVDGAAPASTAGGPAQLFKATNDEIAANYIYGGNIYVDQLRGGQLNADVTITGVMKTADSGQRVEISSQGLRQYGSDGTSVTIDLPNDSSQIAKFSGVVNAFGLVVNNGLEFRGQNNVFAMGSITTLATTTAGSAIAPTLSANYEKVDSGLTRYLYNVRGYHRDADGGNNWAIYTFFGSSLMQAPGGLVYVWPTMNKPDGSTGSQYDFFTATVIRTAGGLRMVTHGNYWASSTTQPVGRIAVWDPSTMTVSNDTPPTLKTSLQHITPNYWVTSRIGRCFSPPGQSALENTFALIEYNSYVTTGNQFKLRLFACTDTTITQQGTDLVINTPWADKSVQPSGVVYGSSSKMGFPGADQNVWVVFVINQAYVFNSAGTRLTDFDFPVAGDAQMVAAVGSTAAAANGFVRFETVPFYDANTLMATRYTNIHWASTDSSVWWVGYTWYDSNGTTHESDISVLASLTMPKRARLTITVPNLPDPAAGSGQPRDVDDVNSFRVYMQRQATAPARTALWRQTLQPADLATTITYDSMPQWSGTFNPPATTSFPTQAASKLQSSAVGADGLPKVLIDGAGQLHGEALDVSGVGSSAFTGKAFEQLYYSIRAQARLSGGGQLSVSTSYEVKWSERFIAIGFGRGSNTAVSGYFDINPPSAGTVINGYGGATNKTVTAAGIPLAGFDSLWYEIPYGSSGGSVNGNFRITNWSSPFTVPNNWVMICVRNADGSPNKVDWAVGPKIAAGGDYFTPIDWTALTLGNSWLTYGAPYAPLAFRRDTDGRVIMRGLIKSGTANTTIATLPSGNWPGYQKMFTGMAASGVARINVFTDGTITVSAYYAGGTNGYVTFDSVEFDINN